MSENRCVCCGKIIPEGRQVCPLCEKDSTVKYKGIDTKRIKEFQRINLPYIYLNEHGKEAMEELLHADSKILTDTQLWMKQQIEAHQEKLFHEEEMFIICEIAKLYFEQCGAIKRILTRLEELEPQYLGVEYTDGVCDAIKIVKEEGGIE